MTTRLQTTLPAVLVGLATVIPAQKTHEIRLVAKPTPIEIAPGKRVTNSWLYNGQLPGPTIRVKEGDKLRVTLLNELPRETTIHFHGLPVPLRVDGVVGASQGPVGVGQEYTYEFEATLPGTYWYHPHVELQTDRGLVAPLIVEPKNASDDPPFDREYVVVLDDWLPFDPPQFRDPNYSDFLINGRTSQGQTPFRVKKDEVVRFRILNASGFTNYVFAIDGHAMRVTHSDGQPVKPVVARALPIGVAERYDVYVTADNPGKWSMAVAKLNDRTKTIVRGVLAYDGSNAKTPPPDFVPQDLKSAPLLSYSQLASATPRGGLTTKPDIVFDINLEGDSRSYAWAINGQQFPNADPLKVSLGKIVRFNIFNKTTHAHPMHIHGHFFRVVGSAGGSKMPLIKETVLIPKGSPTKPTRLDVEFTADAPGKWPFHCHMIYHMDAGMMRMVKYVGTDGDRDALPDGDDFDPEGAHPVTWVDDRFLGYRPGTRVWATGQWVPGQFLAWYVGTELRPRVPLGALGVLGILPILDVGVARVDAKRTASLPISIPNDAGLSGVRAALQAVGTHPSLAPGLRLSTTTILRIR